MVSKKTIGGIIAVVAIISVIALIPVFMYGIGVDSIQVSMGMSSTDLYSSSISDSDDSYNLDQSLPTGVTTLQAEQQRIDPYSYFFGKFNGHVSTSGSGVYSAYIDLKIYLNITTPSSQTIQLGPITLEDLKSAGLNVNMILGPDEISIEEGTYYISLLIEIEITFNDVPVYGPTEIGPIQFNVTLSL
ncbi:MAG: hypothetical protein ACQERB_08605 [Promethearchaeati archaeon]